MATFLDKEKILYHWGAPEGMKDAGSFRKINGPVFYGKRKRT